ncbi:MAG: CerR family C-terminal domain-containing protein [Sphingobium sp.]|nr:CerR family C-terminal domain-containing protein [Sphingobium sp.]
MSTQFIQSAQPALALRLLDAAVIEFGRSGFEGASTRDIAAASGTTMSSITYHFGGKQGLYVACADHIADQISAIHAERMGAIRANPPQTVEQATAALLGLLENFARVMLAPQSEAWSQFITREQQRPTEAFERLYARIMQPMLETAVGLVAITRPSLDEMARRNLVLNVVGMALILRLGRACVSRVMRVDDIDAATAETLIAGLRRSALDLLTEA